MLYIILIIFYFRIEVFLNCFYCFFAQMPFVVLASLGFWFLGNFGISGTAFEYSISSDVEIQEFVNTGHWSPILVKPNHHLYVVGGVDDPYRVLYIYPKLTVGTSLKAVYCGTFGLTKAKIYGFNFES